MTTKQFIGKFEFRDVIRAMSLSLLAWAAITIHNWDRNTAVSIENLNGTLKTINANNDRLSTDLNSAVLHIDHHSGRINLLDTRVTKLEVRADLYHPRPTYGSVSDMIDINPYETETAEFENEIIRPGDLELYTPQVTDIDFIGD